MLRGLAYFTVTLHSGFNRCKRRLLPISPNLKFLNTTEINAGEFYLTILSKTSEGCLCFLSLSTIWIKPQNSGCRTLVFSCPIIRRVLFSPLHQSQFAPILYLYWYTNFSFNNAHLFCKNYARANLSDRAVVSTAICLTERELNLCALLYL